jgi:molecular chaperone HtpG
MAESDQAKPKDEPTAAETRPFQAEVSRLLDIVAHSLYSEREIFLRELISNGADAGDRLRDLALTDPALAKGDGEYRIELTPDTEAGTLTVADNGIGMSRDDLVANLGTIAHSGTTAFLDQLSGDSAKDVSLIGQFGVGFYAAFMVADMVDVVTRRAGEAEAWRWRSDGKGEYTIETAERDDRGTTITLHLREDAKDYLGAEELSRIVKTYSDHIPFPIKLIDGKSAAETINQASALWTRPRNEIDELQYREFYHHVAHAFDDPWLTLHFRAEGVIEYTGLLFVPSTQPMDLFHPDRKPALKLYVKRVFITDDCDELLPSWLRFVRGVVDSEDLDLNVSREMLQNNPVLRRIRSGLTNRILGELEKKAETDAEAYAACWENFGAAVKEGLYEDFEHREPLLKLARFRSTHGDGLSSLTDYAGRMKDGQDAIYYISGDTLEPLAKSPQLEGFRARGVEVLLLTDAIDEFWIPSVGVFDGKPFKSVTRGGADLSGIKADAAAEKDGGKPDDMPAGLERLVASLKINLGDAVKDVRRSERLTDSAVCLVADETDMDIHLERLLKQHKQLEQSFARILEINPEHALIKRLAAEAEKDEGSTFLVDAAHLLLDQARILEGEPLPNPSEFARRFEAVMARSLDG